MGMKKAESTTTAPAPAAAAPVVTPPVATAPAAESGTNAAIERLKKKTEITSSAAKSTGGSRDYNEEARGKTRCAAFGAALASNYIPGLPVKNIDEYLENVRKAADVMVAYTFGELK